MQFEEWASKNLKKRYLSLIKHIEEKRLVEQCTVPFIPYVGPHYYDAKYKMLFIGKATYGWGKGDGGQGSGTLKGVLGRDDLWEHLAYLPQEFIEGTIIPHYGAQRTERPRAFWRRIYQLSGKLLVDHPVADYKRELRRSEECFRSIAWSNVFKVGALKSAKGNPKKRLIGIQKEENNRCGNAFLEEITALEPDVVIFSTGPNEYDEHIGDLLPEVSMDKDVGPPHLRIKEIEGLDTLAFRTCHFQSYSNEEFEQVVEYIYGRVNGTVSEG
jgi:hypothetical protein